MVRGRDRNSCPDVGIVWCLVGINQNSAGRFPAPAISENDVSVLTTSLRNIVWGSKGLLEDSKDSSTPIATSSERPICTSGQQWKQQFTASYAEQLTSLWA